MTFDPDNLPADAARLDDKTRRQIDRGRKLAAAEPAPAAWILLPPPRSFWLRDAVILTAVGLLVACLVGGFLFSLYSNDMHFQDTCTAAGGRVHSFDPDICVTQDGRIMDL